MRITVTLDPDVVCLLKKEAHQRDQSLKITLNDAVRLAFQSRLSPPPKRKPFVVKARPLGLRPGIDPSRLSELADEMEIDAFLDTTKRLREKKR